MDQVKTGAFLRELRKEKGLTQSGLAEHFNVSDRTVSRWETGSNMPDLSLLVELADFYAVDLKELICGERKNGTMETTEKEALKMAADYAAAGKEKLLKELRNQCLLGGLTLALALIISLTGLCSRAFFWNILMLCLYGYTFGVLLTGLLYTTGALEAIGKDPKKHRAIRIVGIVGGCITFLCIVLSLFF